MGSGSEVFRGACRHFRRQRTTQSAWRIHSYRNIRFSVLAFDVSENIRCWLRSALHVSSVTRDDVYPADPTATAQWRATDMTSDDVNGIATAVPGTRGHLWRDKPAGLRCDDAACADHDAAGTIVNGNPCMVRAAREVG